MPDFVQMHMQSAKPRDLFTQIFRNAAGTTLLCKRCGGRNSYWKRVDNDALYAKLPDQHAGKLSYCD